MKKVLLISYFSLIFAGFYLLALSLRWTYYHNNSKYTSYMKERFVSADLIESPEPNLDYCYQDHVYEVTTCGKFPIVYTKVTKLIRMPDVGYYYSKKHNIYHSEIKGKK